MYSLAIIGAIFVSIVTLFNIFLVLAVYIRNPKNLSNKIFTLTGLILNLWIIFMYLSTQPFSKFPSVGFIPLFLIRISIFFAVPMSFLFFLLADVLPEGKIHLSTKKLASLLTTNFIVMLMTISPYVFESLTITDNLLIPLPGPLIVVFAIYVLFLNIAGAYVLIGKLRKYSGIEREQIRYFTLGLILMQGLTITTILIPTNVFHIATFAPLAPGYGFIFLSLTAYAMVRHRLLDIRLVVVRSITYILLIATVGFAYSALFTLISTSIFKSSIELSNIIISTIITILIVFTFQPLRRAIEKITDRFFHQDKYDPNDLLWNLNRSMASTLALSDLSQSVLTELLSAMKISHGALVLIRNDSIIWVDSHGDAHKHSFKGKDISTLITAAYKPKSRHERILIFEEMPESNKSDLKKLMRVNDITVVLPLVVQKKLIGGLIFGEKSSGEIYSSEDIDLLKILTPEIAISVKNALSYEEIRRFNITLEEEVKKATERLRHANSRLKELDQLKDEFVSIASHELRTPMTAIKSYLWLALNKSSQKIEEPLKKYLDISYKSTERLISLVNDMLTVSRIERNKIKLKEEKVDVGMILNLIYDELKITADEKNIDFTLSFEEKKHHFVKGDNDKLREVFQNLIGNALKFTPEKGSIKIQGSTVGNNIVVKVSDTGSGIPKSEQPKLFQKFSKIEYSYSKHSSQPGSGLGLYILKQIVTLHKGTIEVQSIVGKGSVFTVRLPKYTSRVK